jgi:hypothetical protein
MSIWIFECGIIDRIGLRKKDLIPVVGFGTAILSRYQTRSDPSAPPPPVGDSLVPVGALLVCNALDGLLV